ncbi:MAG: FmdB family zinc ribbon protein [Candidatus Methylomirabilales bacterium]
MPTYEYECQVCGRRFEQRQAMSDTPLTECPACHGQVHRIVSGGAGVILSRDVDRGRAGRGGDGCNIDQAGTTCCGRQERCSQPPCGGER